MRSTEKHLSEDSRFLLPINGEASIGSLFGPVQVAVTGEIILRARGGSAARRGLELERLALATGPIKTHRGESGKITVIGDRCPGLLTLGSRRDEWEVSGPCHIHYPELDEAAGKDQERGCYYLPTLLPASVRLTGSLTGVREGRPTGKARLEVACAAGENEAFTTLVVDLAVPWEILVPLGGTGNAHCHPTLEINERRLVLQPVGFRSSTSDPSPSGSTSNTQLGTAATVWGKCCIDLEIRPTVLITNAILKTSSDLTAIRAAYTDPDPNVIEVFFVDNPLTATGGGNAGAIGVASQKIVIAEPNGGNPVLTAHEVGHAVGLLHPPGSDWGTVMQPTGSAMNPGTALVTHFMCQSISQPALQTLLTTCCLTHDTGDHYLRDFPEDIGNEPSVPLPAGRTRYSMSNVWNRLSNTVGTFGANGPDHEHPARFEADGITVKTNYLFARVEQTGTLLVRDATVKFYLKHPGSGGGAINLTLLGQVNVPSGLPEDVSIPWQVPATTPNHSCVFAVVRSPAEPEDDPTGLDWVAMEALSRDDNDWAQRNLNVATNAPANSGNTFSAFPFVIRIPRELREKPPVSLTIDARRAEGLKSILVEIAGDEMHEVPPGKILRLEADARGRDLPVVIRGVVPAKTKIGSSFTINVDSKLGEVDLVGYACELRTTEIKDYLAQFVDTLLAASDDLAAVADLAAAYRLAKRVREALAGGCLTTEVAGELAADLNEHVQAIVEALQGRVAAEIFDLRRALEEWLDALGSGNALAAVEGLFNLARRLQMVAWAIKHPA